MPWVIKEQDGKFCVANQMTGRIVHCHDTREKALAQQRALYANVPDSGKAASFIELDELKAVWTTAYVNNLPDSSFAYIEPGGSKDGEGKTTPRSLRHFPYKDASGKPDAAHVRNALARIPQSSVSDSAKSSALSKVRAAAKELGIQVSEGKSLMSDELDALVFFGGAVKAMGNGKLGGYLVEFADPETKTGNPDLDEEFFASDTDYDLHEGKTATVYYDHGRDPVLKRRKLARATMKVDDVGVWIETQLQLRDDYEKAIYKLAEMGKLGWSSGSAPHLVERKSVGRFTKITAWPLGDDASLTVTPSNYRSQAVSLKSTSAVTVEELLTEVEAEVKAPEPETFTLPSLDAVQVPAARSGDINAYSSEVVTALKVLARHAGELCGILDPFCATVTSKQEFRFVKDGRTISKLTMGHLDDCFKYLTDAETAIVQGKAKIEDLRKTAAMTKSQREAAQEAAKLQFEIFQRLKGETNVN